MSRPPLISDTAARELQAATMQALQGEAKAVAQEIGLGHTNLLNAINPGQADVMRVDLLLRILAKAPNPGPLLRLICGYANWLPVPLPKPGQAHSDVFHRLASAARELGQLSDACLEAYQDGRLSPAERERLTKEARDLQQAAEEFIQAVQ